MTDAKDDRTLLEEVDRLFAVEKLLEAAAKLKEVQDSQLLTPKHEWMLRWAEMMENGMNDLLMLPDFKGSGWKKQAETHGHRDFTVYYHYTLDGHLECRIDSVIESSLLIPIISVFNESDLFDTWMPSFQKPIKMGVQESIKLKEEGRGNQIIRVTANMAWPFKTRECTQHAVAADCIDDHGAIAIQIKSETPEENPDIPESAPNVVPIDFACSMLIRCCPADHPLLDMSRHKYPGDEELILISIKCWVDPHIGGVPKSLIHWISRTIFSRLWSSLLGVAEQVRDGKRPAHAAAIRENLALYEWVEKRTGDMIDKFKEQYSL